MAPADPSIFFLPAFCTPSNCLFIWWIPKESWACFLCEEAKQPGQQGCIYYLNGVLWVNSVTEGTAEWQQEILDRACLKSIYSIPYHWGVFLVCSSASIGAFCVTLLESWGGKKVKCPLKKMPSATIASAPSLSLLLSSSSTTELLVVLEGWSVLCEWHS